MTLSADGMRLAGPAAAGEAAVLRVQRDALLAHPPGHLTRDVNHPGRAYFETARALSDAVIAADPRSAARVLRLALLSSRSGADGRGEIPDPGQQIEVEGAALGRVFPHATQPG
ncbi:hypothetical protein [Engelhardtia mirabilis]|uniref:Uncharacterized protein n=1 Tax=Engelhardtia mirabilis TaxID=2528011 RepID=A0A518BFB6_9BACT|nr:hypothetical protein Pla133_07390 [Planctomycetes bacterium Pla133]QDU99999.1 hypothetical protein Pla86_07380 [Planctomycetes bacterium Pla86]